MKVSLNLVNKFVRVKVSTTDLVELIGTRLGAVESVEDLGQKYQGAVIVKIVELESHFNADKLNVCKVDDGNVTDGVERDERGLIQIVCGAPNVRKDMFAVWLKPGSTVPSTQKDKQPFVLEPKDLRGVISQGMLASSKELDLNNDHDGLLELDKPAVVGQKFSDLYELDDIIIEIENKMLTHRPDCFGILGIAREIAGITGIQFKSPSWYVDSTNKKTDYQKNSLIEVENTIPELVPEFLLQVIQKIEIKPSDVQTQSYLNRLGVRPINNIVDQTNLIMLITGQPFHAYDYDKLQRLEPNLKIPKIVIRKPKLNETVVLLNGKTVKPSKDTILIATENNAIGLGGIMGGSTTEVDRTTKNIVIECGTFDMYSIRRTSMENGIFSEAVTRFNKGQSKLQNIHVLPYITNSIVSGSTGSVESTIVTGNKSDTNKKSFLVNVDFINNLLGLEIKAPKMVQILNNVEIGVKNTNSKLLIKPPFWRTDLDIDEDIAEEVGRLLGYDKLELVLPERSSKPVVKNQDLEFKKKIRQILKSVGANETLTYSFVHGNLIDFSGQDRSRAFKLTNALSPDIQYYRLSLVPSLLEKVHLNVKDGFSKFVLFEMSKIVDKTFKDVNQPTLPAELNRLGLVFVDETNNFGSNFYQAKSYLKFLLAELGLDARVVEIDDLHLDKKFNQASKVFEPLRSGVIYVGNTFLGIIGEPKISTIKNLKLPNKISMIEIDLNKLIEISKSKTYLKLSRFPKIEQDICFRVPVEVKYSDLYNIVIAELNKSFKDSIIKLFPLDIFQDKKSVMKQITLRLSLNSYTKTLKNSDLIDVMQRLESKVKADFSGQIV